MRHALCIAILAAVACDPTRTPITPREAPDVPWPAVALAGPVEGPDTVAAIVGGCFDGSELLAEETEVDYLDNPPDGDDQQVAQLCVSWSAHLDRADCIRRGLIKAGLVPVPLEVP